MRSEVTWARPSLEVPPVFESILQKVREVRWGRRRKDRGELWDGNPYSETSARRHVLAPRDQLCGITDIGCVRQENEDAFHISHDGAVLVVADGMGGHDAGAVASALAIEAIEEFLCGRETELSRVDLVEATLRAALNAAHENVTLAGQDHASGRGMGCTLIVAFVGDDTLHCCHVGDTRCYVSRGGELTQITRDHSFVASLVEDGQITPEQARNHPRKNEVMQAIGMSAGINPDDNAYGLEAGDRVLLCSDGLWGALADDEIARVVASDGSMRQLSTQLVNRANHAGGADNTTVVLYAHTKGRAVLS